MIESIKFTDFSKSPAPYLKSALGWEDGKEFKFSPGLNIIWGRNGSGKSSILKSLAEYTHCSQGGFSMVTETSVHKRFSTRDDLHAGIEVKHDGQSVRHVDGHHKVGLLGGGFDDDFFKEGLMNTVERGSSGQLSSMRLTSILSNKSREIIWKMKPGQVNSVWSAWLVSIEKSLTANIPVGQPTILMDEAEMSMDYKNAENLWKQLSNNKIYQIIVASHHPFALTVESANYIQLTPGYLDECRGLFTSKFAPGKKRVSNGKRKKAQTD